MATWTIYHNPKCSTSVAGLKLLKEAGIEPKVIEYMKAVPSEKQMELLIMKLGVKAEDLLRRKEPLFKERYATLRLNEHEWVQVMRENPELIERPIVVRNSKAVIGRPLELIEDLIG
jgi:arsenate reductase